ncbi:hypothetical protein ACFY36_08995 [Actinoplanes sp. NPDC000266]
MPQQWEWVREPWREWLRRSSTGVDVFLRLNDPDSYRLLLGDEVARAQLAELMGRAERRDCAAAGLGCTRRLDRDCRDPEVCSQDPAGSGGREGPVPGGCDSFTSVSQGLSVRFSADNRHRAVFSGGRLRIDGRPVGEEQTMESYGQWLANRFYVVQAEGPDDHPAQEYTMGSLVTTINSLVVYDADHAIEHVLDPAPDERWTDPRVELADGALHVRPRPAAPPDRVIPVARP